jgi:uncharacterized OsmC-like protein
MANESAQTQADVALKTAQAQKTLKEAQMGPQGGNPADMLNAQAALMGAENDRVDLQLKAKQLDVDNKDISIDGQNRSAERDSREKLAMVKLQQSALEMDHEKEMERLNLAKTQAQAASKPKPGLLG